MKPESCRQIFEKKKIYIYQISWKSVQWERSCFMRTNGRTGGQTDRQTDRYDEATGLYLDTGLYPRHGFFSSTQVFLLDTGFPPRHRFLSLTQGFLLDTGFYPRHRFFSSTHVFLGFPVSISKRWDGSQDSKLPLHASHVALPTYIYQ